MVDFNSIWENQAEFNKKLVDFETIRDNKEEFQKWNNFYTLALHREVSEVLIPSTGKSIGKRTSQRLSPTHWRNWWIVSNIGCVYASCMGSHLKI